MSRVNDLSKTRPRMWRTTLHAEITEFCAEHDLTKEKFILMACANFIAEKKRSAQKTAKKLELGRMKRECIKVAPELFDSNGDMEPATKREGT